MSDLFMMVGSVAFLLIGSFILVFMYSVKKDDGKCGVCGKELKENGYCIPWVVGKRFCPEHYFQLMDYYRGSCKCKNH